MYMKYCTYKIKDKKTKKNKKQKTNNSNIRQSHQTLIWRDSILLLKAEIEIE